MAPAASRVLPLCQNQTIDLNSSSSTTTADNGNGIEDSEIHAVLYIVVTLLFYSLGIIIGIATYLKRERQEIEEEKMYDDFQSFYSESTLQHRYGKVQQVIARLKEIEEKKFWQSRPSNCTKSPSVKSASRKDSSKSILGVSEKGGILKKSDSKERLLKCDSDLQKEKMEEGACKLNSSGYETELQEEDPFLNKRLSAVVAKIFENDGEEVVPLESDILDVQQASFETETDATCSLIDYENEPRNIHKNQDEYPGNTEKDEKERIKLVLKPDTDETVTQEGEPRSAGSSERTPPCTPPWSVTRV